LLERRGLTLKEGFAATITEYLICSFVAAGMSIVGLLYLIQHVKASPVISGIAIAVVSGLGAFLIVSAIAIRRRFYLIGAIVARMASIGVLRGRLRPDMIWINRMEDLLLAVLRDRPARFAIVAVMEAAAQAFLVLEMFWLLRGLAEVVPLRHRGFHEVYRSRIFLYPAAIGRGGGLLCRGLRHTGTASGCGRRRGVCEARSESGGRCDRTDLARTHQQIANRR
jgi:hypothetical protein